MPNGDIKSTPSLELISANVERQLDLQWQVWDAVDARLRLLLGFIGAVFVATLAFSDPTRGLAVPSDILLVLAIGSLLASGLIASLSWLPGKFDRPPNPSWLRDHYLTASTDETQLAVLDTILEAYTENQNRINEKLAGFRNAAIVFGFAILLIAATVIIEVVRDDETEKAIPEPAATAAQAGPGST